jgi:uncharacterized protein YeaO (DUF488 family)
MIKETYFGILKMEIEKNPEAKFIAVSRSIPKGIMIERWMALAPSYGLLNDYKRKTIDWDVYTQRFTYQMRNDPLAQTQIKEIKQLAQDQDIYLVCWEGPDKNCHRHLLVDMINNEVG